MSVRCQQQSQRGSNMDLWQLVLVGEVEQVEVSRGPSLNKQRKSITLPIKKTAELAVNKQSIVTSALKESI